MALIKCPECGRDVSDKAKSCPNCGFPVEEIEAPMDKEQFCPYCGDTLRLEEGAYCLSCGMRVNGYKNNTEPVSRGLEEGNISREFSGVYRSSLFGGLQEVYCPRCGSENCSHYKEQKLIPGKKKTRYTANLNPLKPFTLVNKKEKTVKEERVVTENKFICNSCGKIFL